MRITKLSINFELHVYFKILFEIQMMEKYLRNTNVKFSPSVFMFTFKETERKQNKKKKDPLAKIDRQD